MFLTVLNTGEDIQLVVRLLGSSTNEVKRLERERPGTGSVSSDRYSDINKIGTWYRGEYVLSTSPRGGYQDG